MVQLGRRLFASAGQGSAPPDARRAAAAECLDLVSLLSARFVGISADRVDAEIEAGLRQVLEFFEVDVCVLFEVSEETKISAAHLVGNPGLSAAPMPSVSELFPWSVESVIRSVEALRLQLPDALPAEATKDRTSCEHWALKSMLLIPLRAARVVRGIIAVGVAQRERELPEECIPWLRLLGDIFMNALDRRAMEEAQQETERALRESERRLALTQRLARVGTLEWDTASGRITASEEACHIFGIAPEKYAHPGLGRVIHPDDRSAVQEAIGRTLNGGMRFCVEYRIVRPNGTERIILDQGEVTAVSDAAPARVIRTVQDVTESRQGERELQRLRSQLCHTDRISHVGVLTASIAHELNQPLAAVLFNAQAGLRFLAAGAPDLEELGDILQDVVRDTKRAGAVISGLRTMARRQELERSRIDVAETLREVLELLHSEFLTHQIEVDAQFDANCAVLADKTQIQQVVLNLVMNAIDAMRAQPAKQQRRRLHVSLSYSGEGAVRVAVRDSGAGMPREKLSTVFDAFWTTKPQGMGLGLAVCRSIVEAHGGTIWAEANRDRGVTFIFELPMARKLTVGDAAGVAEAAG